MRRRHTVSQGGKGGTAKKGPTAGVDALVAEARTGLATTTTCRGSLVAPTPSKYCIRRQLFLKVTVPRFSDDARSRTAAVSQQSRCCHDDHVACATYDGLPQPHDA